MGVSMEVNKVRIHDLPEEERPRERLIRNGPESLSNAELLGIILRTGSREENVISLCSRILKEYNIKQLSLANVSRLTQVHGVGKAKAAQIAAVLNLQGGLRFLLKNLNGKSVPQGMSIPLCIPECGNKKKKNL